MGRFLGRVRERWNASEDAGFRLQKPFESLLVSEWRRNPALARELMTRTTRGVLSETLQDAQEIMGTAGAVSGNRK